MVGKGYHHVHLGRQRTRPPMLINTAARPAPAPLAPRSTYIRPHVGFAGKFMIVVVSFVDFVLSSPDALRALVPEHISRRGRCHARQKNTCDHKPAPM